MKILCTIFYYTYIVVAALVCIAVTLFDDICKSMVKLFTGKEK